MADEKDDSTGLILLLAGGAALFLVLRMRQKTQAAAMATTGQGGGIDPTQLGQIAAGGLNFISDFANSLLGGTSGQSSGVPVSTSHGATGIGGGAITYPTQPPPLSGSRVPPGYTGAPSTYTPPPPPPSGYQVQSTSPSIPPYRTAAPLAPPAPMTVRAGTFQTPPIIVRSADSSLMI